MTLPVESCGCHWLPQASHVAQCNTCDPQELHDLPVATNGSHKIPQGGSFDLSSRWVTRSKSMPRLASMGYD